MNLERRPMTITTKCLATVALSVALLLIASCGSTGPEHSQVAASLSKAETFEFDGFEVRVSLGSEDATFWSRPGAADEFDGKATVALHDDGFAAYLTGHNDKVLGVVAVPSGTGLSSKSASMVARSHRTRCGDRQCIQFEMSQPRDGKRVDLNFERAGRSGTLTLTAIPSGSAKTSIGPIR